jgi:hypothetical protein
MDLSGCYMLLLCAAIEPGNATALLRVWCCSCTIVVRPSTYNNNKGMLLAASFPGPSCYYSYSVDANGDLWVAVFPWAAVVGAHASFAIVVGLALCLLPDTGERARVASRAVPSGR